MSLKDSLNSPETGRGAWDEVIEYQARHLSALDLSSSVQDEIIRTLALVIHDLMQ